MQRKDYKVYQWGESQLQNKDLPQIYNNQRLNNVYPFSPIHSFAQMVNALLEPLNKNQKINLQNNTEEILLSIDMKEFDPRDVDITVQGNSVIIKGDSRREEIQERPNYYFTIQRCNRFYQTIPLPAQVKPEKTIARFNNGNLELKMSKGKTTVRSFKPLVEFTDSIDK